MLPGCLALAVMICGWFYLFYSRAAHRLESLEHGPSHRLRMRLRRVCGLLMVLLGVGIYAGSYSVDQEKPALAYALIWSGVMMVLLIILILAMIDVRLTWKMWRNRPRAGS